MTIESKASRNWLWSNPEWLGTEDPNEISRLRLKWEANLEPDRLFNLLQITVMDFDIQAEITGPVAPGCIEDPVLPIDLEIEKEKLRAWCLGVEGWNKQL